MTNFERIKIGVERMNLDELAEAIVGSMYPCAICSSPNAKTTHICEEGSCEKYVKKWLMEECEI